MAVAFIDLTFCFESYSYSNITIYLEVVFYVNIINDLQTLQTYTQGTSITGKIKKKYKTRKIYVVW